MDHRRAPRLTLWRFTRRMCVVVAAGVVLVPGGADGQAWSAPSAHLTDTGYFHSSAPRLSYRDSLVAIARAQVGVRYRYGGESPKSGFDCSGLVKYVMERLDMTLPRTAKNQAALGVVVDRDTSLLRPGDLLLFSTRAQGPVSHVGIYVGAGRFIHASSVAKKVIETRLDRPPAPRIKLWQGVRRIAVSPDDSTWEALPTPER